MGTLRQDLEYGLRMLRQSPSVTAVATLALALGIGATTAIFSVINAVLIHPLGMANTDRLVIIYGVNPKGVAEYPGQADYFDWRDQARSFERMLAWRGRPYTLTGDGQPARVYSHRVSAGFFEFLGLKPALGRTFSEHDYQAGNARVTVLTHRFWMSRFGGDSKVLGRTLKLDADVYTVIGVMQAGDFQLFASARPELWVPLELEAWEKRQRRATFIGVLARLKPGATLQQAQAEMDIIAARLASQYPATNKGWGARVNVAAEDLVADIRPTLLVLLGAVVFVLLIACANVANLLLARTSSRQKEIAIRSALGSSRLRLVRQLLTESLLLGGLGGVLGVLLAYWGIKPLVALIPQNITFAGVGNIRIDRWVLSFSLLASVFTSILFGLAPALQTSKLNLREHLNEEGRGSTIGARGRRFRSLLVVSEVTLAIVLLIGAGLMLQSFQRLQQVNPGFRQDHVLAMTLALPGNRYSPEKSLSFYQELCRRVEALPGVASTGYGSDIPLRQGDFSAPFTIEGSPAPATGTEPRSGPHLVSPGYFQTMGMSLLAGRQFSEQEAKGSPGVVVVNSTMAARHWPGENPIGKKIRVELLSRLSPPSEPVVAIIGVVRDARVKGLAVKPEPEMYFSATQFPIPYSILVVRTGSEPRSMATAVHKAVWALDKDQPVTDVTTMDQVISDSMWQLRFSMALLSIFAAVALVLAASGIFAVMAYSARQRRHEIGIRMALGSTRGGVLILIMTNGLKLALGGAGIGLTAAFVLNRALSTWLYGVGATTQTVNQWLPSAQRGLLYGVSATDPLTFGIIATLLTTVALLASYIPARRAAQVDPMVALRHG
jgi:predicted permease